MPLDDAAVETLMTTLGITTAGRDIVRTLREGSGPARRVHGGRSVMSRFASRKMSETRQCESRTLEAPATTIYEHDNDVLAYYDQPTTLTLDYSSPGSQRKTTRHIPDFLVLRQKEIAVEEWKTEAELQTKLLSHPGRYLKGADGRWRQPAAERRCESLGLVYRICTEVDLPELLVRNWRLLAPHVGATMGDPVGLITYVRDVPGVSIAEVLEKVPGMTIATVLAAIAAGLIWVDLRRVLLTEHVRVALFEGEERGRLLQQPIALIPTGAVSLADGSQLLWSGVHHKVANAGPLTITLEDASGALKPISRAAALELIGIGELRATGTKIVDRAALVKDVSNEAIAVAYGRLEALRPYLDEGLRPRGRTHQRWLRSYHEARVTLGDGLLGLIPRESGSSERKVEPRALKLAQDVITEIVLTAERRPYHSGYKIYVERCSNLGIKPMSAPTYRHEIRSMSDHRAIRRRLGRKVANALHGPRPRNAFPVDGDRAFERAHIDHTKLDIDIVDSVTGSILGRPWLTLAIDAYTRRIIGHVLTFAPPSSGSVMLVIRDIVARYGRLPAWFVTDNGSEFKGAYFQTTAAAFEVSLEYRPPLDPRFGAVIESCFGKLNSDLIHFLRGNTVGRKDVRSQDSENDADKLAVWPLGALDENLSTYLYEVYDKMTASTGPAVGLSPRERFESSVRLTGVADRESISDDQHFRVMTAPGIPTRVRVGRQGIKAKRVRYWCAAFDRPGVRRSLVEARWEPFDRSRAYAFVEGEWHVCFATHHELLVNRTERELRIASIELGERLKRTPSTRELARHLEATLKTEKALLEQLRARESAQVVAAGPAPSTSNATAPTMPPALPTDTQPKTLDVWSAPS